MEKYYKCKKEQDRRECIEKKYELKSGKGG